MMREISARLISAAVEGLFLDACCNLGDDAISALDKALKDEVSPFGVEVIKQLKENAMIARENNRPCCQDTGMAVVFIELGQDLYISKGYLEDAINEGVRRAYVGGNLRLSVLGALDRKNTLDNSPAVIHVRIVPGDTIKITVTPKGFGSENMSALAMLKPSDGIEGIINFVVSTVEKAGSNPCPPVVVGVGIGGTMEKAAIMAKEQLLRDVGTHSKDAQIAKLEEEILSKINALGIGPMGLGGSVTALAVHIAQFPTHLAGLPVAVNMQCHSARHKSITL